MAQQTVRLRVSGMTCEHCVRTVTQALLGVAGVAEAMVDLATETATVVMDDAVATVDELIAAIEDEGYAADQE